MYEDFKFEQYIEQNRQWPKDGRHILAHFDENSIIVYQAFNANIAAAAVISQNFNSKECLKSGYSLSRMSWIKTNFLWMMYRSGWATKHNQEKILAIRIKRDGFEEILSKSILSSTRENNDEEEEPQNKNKIKPNRTDEIRLQWDPDHDPNGTKVASGRRAIQIGLRNAMLKNFCDEYIIKIYDITDFVIEQRKKCIETDDYSTLMLPAENVYKIDNNEISNRIFLSPFED